MNKIVKCGSLGIVVVAFLAACSAKSEEEASAKVDQALGEPACGSNPITGASEGVVITNPSFHCWWDNEATSPSSYGSSGCDGQFVVEVDNITKYVNPAYFIVNPATNIDQATCSRVHMTLGAYGHDSAGWHVLGSAISHGEWRAQDGIIAAHCEMVNEVNTVPRLDTAKYDRARAAASLYTIELLKGSPYNSYLPVTTGLRGGNGC